MRGDAVPVDGRGGGRDPAAGSDEQRASAGCRDCCAARRAPALGRAGLVVDGAERSWSVLLTMTARALMAVDSERRADGHDRPDPPLRHASRGDGEPLAEPDAAGASRVDAPPSPPSSSASASGRSR